MAKLTKMLTLYGIKMFANPLNAIKKDGPNKTLIHTPELTKEEAKVMIAKLREAEILATYREVEPSTEKYEGVFLFITKRKWQRMILN